MPGEYRICRGALPKLLPLVLLLAPGERGSAGEVGTNVSVRINEVLPSPVEGGAGGAGEWVELFNNGPAAVDLAGWHMGDEVDPNDRLIPFHGGETTLLRAGGYALVLDPQTAFPPGGDGAAADAVLVRPDDGSIGNGLRAAGDRLILADASGKALDTAVWSASAGPGRSWERADPPFSATAAWLVCRHERGSTPGEPNSWTPVAGDRAVHWVRPLRTGRAGERVELAAVLSDEGGAGLYDLLLDASVEREGGGLYPLDIQRADVAPFDSVRVTWIWEPPAGGSWIARLKVLAPVRERSWGDRDSLQATIAWKERARVVSEVLSQPEVGEPEWLELWEPAPTLPAGPPTWEGWLLRVRGASSAGSTARTLRLPDVRGSVLLIRAGASALPDPPAGGISSAVLLWPGLRLSDEGSQVVLEDPTGAVADSAVLRSVAGLPRGHSVHRHAPDLPGWLPAAWRISMQPGENTPGLPPAPAPSPVSGDPEGGFSLKWRQGQEGITFVWRSPAGRLWIEARLYDLEGGLAAVPIPRSLQPGSWSLLWQPHDPASVVTPGIYVLVVQARAEEGEGAWRIRRALGVRP